MSDNNQKEDSTETVAEETEKVDYQQIIDEKEKEIKNLYNQLIRLKADFDNYRKRIDREKENIYVSGKENILIKLVSLTDALEKATESAKKSENIKDIIHGLELLEKEFVTFLEKEGVKAIDSKGKKIDPSFHEIIGTKDTDKVEEDTILEEIQRGYVLFDWVIRPAKVIVAKKKTLNKKETKTDNQASKE